MSIFQAGSSLLNVVSTRQLASTTTLEMHRNKNLECKLALFAGSIPAYKLQQQYTTLIVIIKTALQQIIFTLSYVYILIWCESATRLLFFLNTSQNMISSSKTNVMYVLVCGFAYDLREKSISYSYWQSIGKLCHLYR